MVLLSAHVRHDEHDVRTLTSLCSVCGRCCAADHPGCEQALHERHQDAGAAHAILADPHICIDSICLHQLTRASRTKKLQHTRARSAKRNASTSCVRVAMVCCSYYMNIGLGRGGARAQLARDRGRSRRAAAPPPGIATDHRGKPTYTKTAGGGSWTRG